MTTAHPPRHVRAAPRGVARSLVARMLTVTAAVAAAVAVGVAASGGTYAFLTASRSTGGGTIAAGTATLSVTTPLALPTTALYPGAKVAAAAVVKNTGDVPLVVRAAGLTRTSSSTAFSQALVIRVGVVSSTAACTTAATPSWSGTFAAATTSDLPLTLAKQGSGVLCVIAELATTAPDAAKGLAATTFTVNIDGRQP
ncbi:hypothetical protein [Herbiconiux sp. A18JL235]|uniref:Ribosomally synthesized peptide with SipW-like signal peptide n=1 Tax=Herbiconiux sp. A18JL235 TaxID=3152363 RepID=A0AB39BLC4_9MICO